MAEEYDFKVSLTYFKGEGPLQEEKVTVDETVKATDENDALNKVKIKHSVHPGGKYYQPVSKASVLKL